MTTSHEQHPGYDGPVADHMEVVVHSPGAYRDPSEAPTEILDPTEFGPSQNTTRLLGGIATEATGAPHDYLKDRMEREQQYEYGVKRAAWEDKNPKIPDATTENVKSEVVRAAMENRSPHLTLRPTRGSEVRAAEKAGRRHKRALRQGSEKFRLLQSFGARLGAGRTPLFLKGTAQPTTSSVNRSGQEQARSDRFGRESDLGTDEQLARLAEGRFTRPETRAELKARRKYLAADEAQRELIKSNEYMRDGVDTLGRKLVRVKNRAVRGWKARGR